VRFTSPKKSSKFCLSENQPLTVSFQPSACSGYGFAFTDR
jgi:hypothetical protein